MSRQWTADLRPLKTDPIKEYLTDAPYLILAFKQIYGNFDSKMKSVRHSQLDFVVGIRSDGTKQQHYYNDISMSIAIGILLCALQSVGLNSLVNILFSQIHTLVIMHIYSCLFFFLFQFFFFAAWNMCHFRAASTNRFGFFRFAFFFFSHSVGCLSVCEL